MVVKNIYIDNFIGYDQQKKVKGVTLADVVASVTASKEPYDILKVNFVNTPGGCIETGKDIWSYLQSLDKPIHTHAVGMVASISSWMYVQGETRTADEQGVAIMVHNPFVNGLSKADADTLQAIGREIKKDELFMAKTYAIKTNQPLDVIRKFMKDETFLDTNTAFKIGFITEEPKKIKAVAFFSNNNKQKMIKDKSILDKIKDALSTSQKMALSVKTADEKTLVFEGEKETYEVGDKAILKGGEEDVDADGTFLVKGGKEELTFEAGELKTIIPVEEAPASDEDAPDMLAKLQEEIDAMKAKQVKTEASYKNKFEALEKQNKEYKTTFLKLGALVSEEIVDTDLSADSTTKVEDKNKSENQFF